MGYKKQCGEVQPLPLPSKQKNVHGGGSGGLRHGGNGSDVDAL
jgi:hypothetical protein